MKSTMMTVNQIPVLMEEHAWTKLITTSVTVWKALAVVTVKMILMSVPPTHVKTMEYATTMSIPLPVRVGLVSVVHDARIITMIVLPAHA